MSVTDGHEDVALTRARAEADAAAKLKPEKRFALAPRDANEETRFLMGLRRLARLSGVTVSRMTSHSSTYGEDASRSGPPPADGPDPKKVLDGITKVACDLTLSGPYPALRRFITGVWDSDRLYVVNGIAWSRTPSGSELVMTLNRYIAPSPPSTKS